MPSYGLTIHFKHKHQHLLRAPPRLLATSLLTLMLLHVFAVTYQQPRNIIIQHAGRGRVHRPWRHRM